MRFSTRQIVVAGMLGAVAIILAATGIGMIPMPTGVHATIMHVPAILGGILEGPLVGAAVGLIFGLYSFLTPANPAFADPLVAILPRLFIGVLAYYTYKATKSSALAAVVGTATNTVGVLGMSVVRGYWPLKFVITVAVAHGIPEIVVAVIIVVILVRALKSRLKPASVSQNV
ncbi:MAG: ECF transporter S component [Syntrophothermus sp.]